MLGDTTGTAPEVVDGTGCTATTKAISADGTVYSMFAYLSALLDGYANASGGCRTEILSELDSAIGPAAPDATVCQANASATCALLASRTSVQNSLADLVVRGQQIVDGLNTAPAGNGLTAQAQVTSTLSLIGQAIAALATNSNDKSRWNDLLTQIHAAQATSTALGTLRTNMTTLRAGLDGGAGSVAQQQIDVARQICEVKNANPTVPQASLDAISAQITGRDCANAPVSASALPPNGSLEQRLHAQAALLDQTITALDTNAPASALHDLDSALTALETNVTQALTAIDSNNSDGQASATTLAGLLATATTANQVIGTNLTQIQTDQQTLGQQITQGFVDAGQSADQAIGTEISAEIDSLNAQHQQTQQELGTSYQTLIDSLRGSAAKTLSDGKTLVDGQQQSLIAEQTTATQALDKSTTTALQTIQASTSAATQDTDAASQQLTSSLENVLLDLGSPKVTGSGILGSMAASAAKSATADFQLAEASQSAAGFANVRDEDVSGLLLRQAQFQAALGKATTPAPFHLKIPRSATSQTLYTFHVEGVTK